MSNAKIQTGGNGIGFGGFLALLFIGLKLGSVITWPWLWVLSPLWIPLAIVVAIIVIGLAFAGIVVAIAKIAEACQR